MTITKLLTSYPKTLALLLGVISVGSLPPYYILPTAFLCFGGLLLLLCANSAAKTAFALGYWFGFGHFSIGFSWIANALLIDAQTYGWLYPVCILAAGAFFGLFTAFPALLTAPFKTPLSKLFAFAGLWTTSEWLRSFILTGFPWNLLGSALTFRPEYFQTASLWGTYGLTLILLLWSMAPALFFFPPKYNRLAAVGLLTVIPLFVVAFGCGRIKNLSPEFAKPGITVRMVQPAIAQETKWDNAAIEENFAKHIRLGSAPGLADADFVIWGETASPFRLDIDSRHRQKVLKTVPPHGYLLTGLVRVQTSPYGHLLPYNSMMIIDSQGQIVDYYDKAHLVPFGEYIPLRRFLPDWIKPITNTIANFEAGPGPRTLTIGNHPPFGVLICYEIIFPGQIVDRNNRPQWLINLTNDAWYGDSAGPRQHLIAARLRAVEEGLSLVRVANSGISAAFDPLGHIIGQIPLNRSAILDVTLPEKLSTTTFYGKYGNFVPISLILLNIILAICFSLHKF